jgi:hypothetical protein
VKPSNKLLPVLLGLAGLLLTGCSTVQPTAFPIGNRLHPAKASTAPVQLFRDALPDRKYEPVAKLNVHLEKTHFIPSTFAEALPKLEDLARRHGADAIIQIEEKKSRLNETFIYNVTATAIVFTD